MFKRFRLRLLRKLAHAKVWNLYAFEIALLITAAILNPGASLGEFVIEGLAAVIATLQGFALVIWAGSKYEQLPAGERAQLSLEAHQSQTREDTK